MTSNELSVGDRVLLDKFIEKRDKQRQMSADYCRRRYATDPEYVAKKTAYRKARYASDAEYREGLQRKASEARAKAGALKALARMFTPAK